MRIDILESGTVTRRMDEATPSGTGQPADRGMTQATRPQKGRVIEDIVAATLAMHAETRAQTSKKTHLSRQLLGDLLMHHSWHPSPRQMPSEQLLAVAYGWQSADLHGALQRGRKTPSQETLKSLPPSRNHSRDEAPEGVASMDTHECLTVGRCCTSQSSYRMQAAVYCLYSVMMALCTGACRRFLQEFINAGAAVLQQESLLFIS